MASFGGSIKLTGADEYRNALRQITQSLRETGSELTTVASRYDKNDSSLSTLKAKTTELNGVLEKQVQAYNNLKGSYDTFSSKVNEQATQHQKLVQEYEKEKAKLEEIRKASGENSQAYQDQQAKVNDLATAVAKSSQNMNENEIALSKMKTQLNQAETAVNKTTKEIDELGNETEESGKKAEKSGEGYTVFKNILANLGTQAINSALNGIKKLGGAFLNIGKQALESYGEFEQLVGGVETLFGTGGLSVEEYAKKVGKSVGEVQEAWTNMDTAQADVLYNAQNAYRTAGLSANEYMNTVTSFSASLIQSLEGDTLKASSYADRAITDMSDNANKMGTDISMIQNAYQGFAKQNYTMLDNLKLGYGGTKTEMERLIKDASGMTKEMQELGVSVDATDMSFGNIVNAISVMQKHMGIAGTTAKEAGTTIQGSVNSMKSAWTNLVTGMADENANIEDLVRNLMLTIAGDGTENNLGVLGNVLPAVNNIINGIVDTLPLLVGQIIEYLPYLIDAGAELLGALVLGIQDNLPAVMTATTTVLNTLTSALIQGLPEILKMGVQVIVSLVQGLAQQLPTLIPQMVEAVLTMVDTLIDNIDLIIDAGIQLIIGLAEGLINALPQLIDKIPIIIDKLVTAIINNLPKIIQMGITLIVKLAEGLIKAIPQLISKVPQIISSLLNAITSGGFSKMLNAGKDLLNKIKDGIVSGIGKLGDVGKNLVQGLWNGINNAKDWVLGKIKGFGKAILNGIKSIFGIHSPSTVFRDEVGKNLALGIGEGFTDEMATVTNEMQNSIPTSFDTDLNVGSSSASGSNSYTNMVEAFKEALSEMKIELDDEQVGRFVETTVTNAIYN